MTKRDVQHEPKLQLSLPHGHLRDIPNTEIQRRCHIASPSDKSSKNATLVFRQLNVALPVTSLDQPGLMRHRALNFRKCLSVRHRGQDIFVPGALNGSRVHVERGPKKGPVTRLGAREATANEFLCVDNIRPHPFYLSTFY